MLGCKKPWAVRNEGLYEIMDFEKWTVMKISGLKEMEIFVREIESSEKWRVVRNGGL